MAEQFSSGGFVRQALIGRRTTKVSLGQRQYNPPFSTAKELARKLSELPQAYYTKPKSTESFLSQIFKGESPVPNILRDELLRCLESLSDYPSSDRANCEAHLRIAIGTHNTTLKENTLALDGVSDRLRFGFWLKVRNVESTEHFVISSSALRESNPLVFKTLFEVQVPALGLSRPSDFNLATWTFSGEQYTAPLWNRDSSEMSFTHLVESKKSALSLWTELFLHACNRHVSDNDNGKHFDAIQSIPVGIKTTVAELFRKCESKQCIHVFRMSEDFNFLCGSLIMAISPRSPSGISVFSAANDWIIPFSMRENHAWRDLVYLAKNEILSKSQRCSWKDVEQTITG